MMVAVLVSVLVELMLVSLTEMEILMVIVVEKMKSHQHRY